MQGLFVSQGDVAQIMCELCPLVNVYERTDSTSWYAILFSLG